MVYTVLGAHNSSKLSNTMAPNTHTWQQHYKDLRAALPPRSKSLSPITSALVSQLPFPDGVVPPSVAPDFLEVPPHLQTEGFANAWANGQSIDSLVMLLRLALALGLDPKESRERQLLELAFHDFGRNRVDDYIIKGKMLESLYPHQTMPAKLPTGHPEGFRPNRPGRVDVTLGELIQHPSVVAALWSHPFLQFFRQHTWAKKTRQG